MSGHSKWSTIKHKKAKTDSQRGKIFTKIVREITTATRTGGEDADANPRLRIAIQKAKSVNMPADNIKRAIQKGAGGKAEDQYEEILFEGYAFDGIALLIETLTDNRNRTVPNIRSILSKANGNLATKGAVAYMFEKKGVLIFEPGVSEDAVIDTCITAGAEDVVLDDDLSIEVLTSPENYESVLTACQAVNLIPVESTITMIAQNKVQLTIEQAKKLITLTEKLEEDDDVQAVYSNAIIPPEAFEDT